MRFYATILIFLLTHLTIIAQCIDKEKITYGGDYGFVDYIHRCPTYNFAYGGDTLRNWNMFGDPIDIIQAPKNLMDLKKKVEMQIKKYAGTKFFSKVKFKSVDVVYADKLKSFKAHGQLGVTLKFCKAKYFFYYEFKPDTIATYHIGIALDNSGKIISKFHFPSKENYQPIDTSFTYCRLIEIARKSQHDIDPIAEIKFEYNEKEKKFYWLISQDILNKKEGLNYMNEVIIDAADLTKTVNTTGRASIRY